MVKYHLPLRNLETLNFWQKLSMGMTLKKINQMKVSEIPCYVFRFVHNPDG